MKTRFLLALALFAPLLATGGPKNIKGYVYQDDNRNGVFDKTEKGIPGVAVSNGREVVLTDRKGRYQLPVTGPCELFVIKPTGYATPTNRYGISQSYYLYRPEGSSTRMKYPGIAPTGELPPRSIFRSILRTNRRISVFWSSATRSAATGKTRNTSAGK